LNIVANAVVDLAIFVIDTVADIGVEIDTIVDIGVLIDAVVDLGTFFSTLLLISENCNQ
jgi:hypothetical protein